MSCNKFKKLLSVYLDDEIKKGEEKKLFQHLKFCQNCNKELEYYKKFKNIFSLKETKVPQEFFETRLFSTINTSQKQHIVKNIPSFAKISFAILIISVLIFGIINFKKFTITSTIIEFDQQQNLENLETELLEIYYLSY